MKAAKALKVKWRPGSIREPEFGRLFSSSSPAARQNEKAGAAWVLEGDVDKGFGSPKRCSSMEYTTDMVCHATMEPLNATVQIHPTASGTSTSARRAHRLRA